MSWESGVYNVCVINQQIGHGLQSTGGDYRKHPLVVAMEILPMVTQRTNEKIAISGPLLVQLVHGF
jgi:hypothetical protein